MSTGPEHYRQAEQYRDQAARWAHHTPETEAIVTAINGLTSAVLAAAAAAAMPAVIGGEGTTGEEWRLVIVPDKKTMARARATHAATREDASDE